MNSSMIFRPVFVLLWIGVFAVGGVVHADQGGIKNYAACMDCHGGIETLDADHAFACVQCHLERRDRRRPLARHDAIVRHPAAPNNAERFCIPCHRAEIDAVNNSLHYTLAGVINQTRYLWGAQAQPNAQFAAGDHPVLKTLPQPPPQIRTPADLVDDLLRKRCLNCHAGRKPPAARGFHRGVGCAACHLPYADDGVYRGDDLTMIGKKGYPLRHRFAAPIETRQCLHCHNGPRVGADYAGYFEHDYHQTYRAPVQNGALAAPLYLMDHHRLRPDIHFQKGLICVDCHGREDVMGNGVIHAGQYAAVGVRCRHCHKPSNQSANPQKRHAHRTQRFISRRGEVLQPPLYKTDSTAHAIPAMQNVHCQGCHASWQFNDYGASLVRDDRADLSQWRPWRLQGDPRVANAFQPTADNAPRASPGVWLLGWRFRRWEFISLGRDNQNRITPFRPHHQYRVTYVAADGQMVIDSRTPRRGDGGAKGWAYMPIHAHTVQKRGRSCEACHGQPMAAGLGLYHGQGPDLALTRPDPPVYPFFKLLDPNTQQKLMNKSPVYRQQRFRILWSDFQN